MSATLLTVSLNRPDRHNAFGRAVRDGLIEALDLTDYDDSISEIVLRGEGKSFCTAATSTSSQRRPMSVPPT